MEDPLDLTNLSHGTSPPGRERIMTAIRLDLAEAEGVQIALPCCSELTYKHTGVHTPHRSAAAHAATMGQALNWYASCYRLERHSLAVEPIPTQKLAEME
eukprot:3748054-Amphidinium_carterae.1